MNINDKEADIIWIVERVHNEQYVQSRCVITWHKSPAEAEGMAARLQAEFDQACELVRPLHENVETIFEMREEQELASYHVQTDCSLEECCHLENPHQHRTQVEPKDHEKALIEQLTAWWHQEDLAWQIFTEDEVMAKMADPPCYCRELVQPSKAVHYECHAVSRDPAVTRARRAERTKQD